MENVLYFLFQNNQEVAKYLSFNSNLPQRRAVDLLCPFLQVYLPYRRCNLRIRGVELYRRLGNYEIVGFCFLGSRMITHI
jgi:hypothetical protein